MAEGSSGQGIPGIKKEKIHEKIKTPSTRVPKTADSTGQSDEIATGQESQGTEKEMAKRE
jgi:hypothetical protein